MKKGKERKKELTIRPHPKVDLNIRTKYQKNKENMKETKKEQKKEKKRKQKKVIIKYLCFFRPHPLQT